MSRQGKFWEAVENKGKKNNPEPVQVGEIISLNPFVILFLGVEIGFSKGDTIYINHLILDENINLSPRGAVNDPQNITEMTPPPLIDHIVSRSDYTAKISGSQLNLLTQFYDWFKAVHNRYILNVGDFVAVQKLGNNTYIVTEKVQKIGY